MKRAKEPFSVWSIFRDPDHVILKNPVVINGWKYGTDCKMAIRIRTDEPNTVPPNNGRRLPQLSDVFASLKPRDQLTRFTFPVNPGCERCKGRCKLRKSSQCDECSGTGGIVCPHCDMKIDCRDCGGEGRHRWEEDCPECFEAMILWLSDEYYLDSGLVEKLKLCRVTHVYHDGQTDMPAIFDIEIDGKPGDGLIMPRCRELSLEEIMRPSGSSEFKEPAN